MNEPDISAFDDDIIREDIRRQQAEYAREAARAVRLQRYIGCALAECGGTDLPELFGEDVGDIIETVREMCPVEDEPGLTDVVKSIRILLGAAGRLAAAMAKHNDRTYNPLNSDEGPIDV